MTPIISPWLVYWINVIPNIGGLFTILAFLLGCAIVIYGIMNISGGFDYSEKPSILTRWVVSLMFIISITIATLMPDRKTLITMVVAQNVTYDRVDSLKTGVKDIHDILKQDVIDIMEEFKDETKKEEVK